MSDTTTPLHKLYGRNYLPPPQREAPPMTDWFDPRSIDSVLRANSIDDAWDKTRLHASGVLATSMVNHQLNEFVGDYADYEEGDPDPHGHGKRVPYVGWFWRRTNWVDRQITISDCGDFVGVTESNKWGYPQRALTREEADAAITIIWTASHDIPMGSMAVTEGFKKAELSKLWELFQTFTIKGDAQ